MRVGRTGMRVLVGFLFLAFAVGVFAPWHGARAAAIGMVQTQNVVGDSVTINSTGSGNLLVVAVAYSGGVLTGITDNAPGGSNTYVSAGVDSFAGPGNPNGTTTIWYVKNSKSGATAVTQSGISGTKAITFWEFSGVDTGTPLDATSTLPNQSSSLTPVGPSLATRLPGELIISSVIVANNITGIHAGNVFTNDSTAFGDGFAHLIATSTGTFNAQWDQDVSGIYASNAVSFKPAVIAGFQVSSRSDTLSNSQPSATSNHTIAFTINTSLDNTGGSASDTVVLTFPNFSLANITCGDIDVSTGTQFLLNVSGDGAKTNCPNTATSWGMFINSGGGTITLVTPSNVQTYVATGTQITVKIGSNATSQNQGAHWITNPSSAGIYTISVGGTFGGAGNMLVSINAGVQVSATVAESLALTVSSVNAVNCTADDGATVNSVTSTATSVPFGTISLNAFSQGCQDLVVSTNAGNGYSLTVQESSAMKTVDGRFMIPDTTCDGGTCSESVAAAWTNAAKNGLGHTCANQLNHDCNSAYSSGTLFRQAADLSQGETAQSVMSSSTAATATGRMKYRLSAGAGQAAGIYTTIITYIITGTY